MNLKGFYEGFVKVGTAQGFNELEICQLVKISDDRSIIGEAIENAQNIKEDEKNRKLLDTGVITPPPQQEHAPAVQSTGLVEPTHSEEIRDALLEALLKYGPSAGGALGGGGLGALLGEQLGHPYIGAGLGAGLGGLGGEALRRYL